MLLGHSRDRLVLSSFLLISLLTPAAIQAQANFGAQLRGTVSDSSGAVVPGATVTITNNGTGAINKITTDGQGRYLFNNLAPASYSIAAEAQGFRKQLQTDLALRVSQEAVLPLVLEVGVAGQSIEVHADSVLLNSANGELGQEVTSRYITEVPLLNRDITKLAYLAPGVTEAQGFQADQTHENFVSNGQRNSSAELRLDGSILSVPEAGEGALFWSHFQPSIELVDEFKVQTNGFSAQYGSNGGTVINIVSKSGTNALHGAGFWFGQRSQLNANNFFSNRGGQAIPDYKRDQFGGALGGPIVKNKTFFFVDYDQTILNQPQGVTTNVPTDLERKGDFSQTFNNDGTLRLIYDPFTAKAGMTNGQTDVVRQPYPGNVIPASEVDPIAAKIVALYPSATGSGDLYTHINNFSKNYSVGQPQHQFNIKIDHNLTDNDRLSGRFSDGYLERQSPTDFLGALGQGDEVNNFYNGVVEYTKTLSPTLLFVARASVDRHHQNRLPNVDTDPVTLGFPSILDTVNGKATFPSINVEGYQGFGIGGWTETVEAQTQWVLDGFVSKVVGPHNMSVGGESRILLSNFFQPAFPGGQFNFGHGQTTQSVFSPDSYCPNQPCELQGNGLASLLTGTLQGGTLSIHPSVAQKSRETSFFFQDDWKVNPRLTLNLGLRYEWSTPYDDRYNRLEFANFTGDTGVNVPGIGEIKGYARFATPSNRTVGSDWNNLAPRLGFAYQLNSKTVIRGGGGLYYGVNYATSYQDVGAAFRKSLSVQPSLDNYVTRYSTLENPFPAGGAVQGNQYGMLNQWGFSSDSNLSSTFRNAEIYQWSFSVQHQLPGSQTVEVAYSANRSTHLPDAYTRNRNIISTADRQQYGTSGLYQYVTNPFYSFFVGPNAKLNQPDSVYAQPTTQLINLLRPYPQFPGNFDGLAQFVANSWYNSLQLKYEKRYSHGLNLVVNYTYAKQTDDSSASSDGWLGNSPGTQDYNNLRGEYSVGATDVRQRFVIGGSYELPVGRNRLIGGNWNHLTDALLGGWQINGYLTVQSGLPLNINMASGRLADGSQRPNVTGNPRSQYSIKDVVNCQGTCSLFNLSAFSDPGDQMAGNEPRFSDVLRGDGIRQLDFSLFKVLSFHERHKVQLRAEFFNFLNTPRFGDPDTNFGDTYFGSIGSQVNNPRQAQFGARVSF